MNPSKEQRQVAERLLVGLNQHVVAADLADGGFCKVVRREVSGVVASVGVREAGRAVLNDLVSHLANIARRQVGEKSIEGSILDCYLNALAGQANDANPELQVDLDTLLRAIAGIDQREQLFLFPITGARNRGFAFTLVGATVGPPTVRGIRDVLRLAGWDLSEFEGVWAHGPDDAWLHSLGSIDGFCATRGWGDSEAAFLHARAAARSSLAVANLLLDTTGYWHCRLRLIGEHDAPIGARVLYLGKGRHGFRGLGDVLMNESREEYKVQMPHQCLAASLGHPEVVAVDALFKACADGVASRYDHQLARMWVWLGRAKASRDASERFLNTIIALEAGLCTAEEEKIAKALADHTSIILNEDADERLAIHRRVKGWYTRRCGIVHTGGDHLSDTDADQALWTALDVAHRLTRHRSRWRTVEDLRRELSECLLGRRHSWERAANPAATAPGPA